MYLFYGSVVHPFALMFSLERVRGGKRKEEGRGTKESPACFCLSPFVEMTGKQIRALKANGRKINLAESERLRERGVGNVRGRRGGLHSEPRAGPLAPLFAQPPFPGRAEAVEELRLGHGHPCGYSHRLCPPEPGIGVLSGGGVRAMLRREPGFRKTFGASGVPIPDREANEYPLLSWSPALPRKSSLRMETDKRLA